jgi:pimeloyl-ACP methyl ester carboxylesterase
MRPPADVAVEPGWLDVAGRPLYAWRAAGAPGAPAVVLVHGLGVSGRYMTPLADALAGDARLLVPDLPGFGRSPAPPGPLDTAGLADAVVDAMTAAGLERATLVGNSYGCQIAVEAAGRHPERIESVVLVGPTLDPEARSVLRQLGRLALAAFVEPPSLTALALADYVRCGPRRVVATIRHALAHDMASALAAVRVPALVVRGGRDPIVPRRWAERAARLARARLVEIPGGGHALNYDAPRRLARVVRAWVRRATLGPLGDGRCRRRRGARRGPTIEETCAEA